MSSEVLSLFAESADRLDKALTATHPEISRARFQRLIAEGHVTVEGTITTDGGAKTKPGQTITVTLPPPVAAEPEGEDIPLDVLFEDKHLIVINKPAGLVVHPAAGHEGGTLVNALIAHCGDTLSGIGGVKRPGIVHRLDKDTSGVLVVAKNDAAHAALSAQFAAHGRDGKLERAYLAFVWGVPERKAGMITTGIGRSSANRQKMAVSNKSDARESITHFDVKEVFGTAACLFECRLETGRTHQIRVHMAHIGHPLLGDRVYGSGYKSAEARLPERARNALNALKGQALHAYLLAFEHPVTKKKLNFQSPLPKDLSQLHHELKMKSALKQIA